MMNGARADFAEANVYAGLGTDAAKKALFRGVYDKLYADGQGGLLQAGNVSLQAEPDCSLCNTTARNILTALATKVEASAAFTESVTDVVIGCVLSAAFAKNIYACFSGAGLTSTLQGTFTSVGNAQSFIAKLDADRIVEQLRDDLEDCIGRLIRQVPACQGGVAIDSRVGLYKGTTGQQVRVNFGVLNSSRYPVLADIFTFGSTFPQKTVLLKENTLAPGSPGTNSEYQDQAGYVCVSPGKRQNQITVSPQRVQVTLTQPSTAFFDLECSVLPTLAFTVPARGSLVPSGARVPLEAILENNGYSETSRSEIASRGFVWKSTTSYIPTGCAAPQGTSDSLGALGSSGGNIGSSLNLVSNTYSAPVKNNSCDVSVNVAVTSKWRPNAVKTSTAFIVSRIRLESATVSPSLSPGQRYVLPPVNVINDATNSGYAWLSPVVFDNNQWVYNVPSGQATGTTVKLTAVSNADSNAVLAFDVRVDNKFSVAILNVPYNGPAQNCARVTGTISGIELAIIQSLTVYIDDVIQPSVLSANGTGLFTAGRSCNFGIGDHILRASLTTNQGTFVSTARFAVQNDRWPGVIVTTLTGCPSTWRVQVTKPDPDEFFTLADGGGVRTAIRGGQFSPFRIRVIDTANNTIIDPEIIKDGGFALPFNGDPLDYGGSLGLGYWRLQTGGSCTARTNSAGERQTPSFRAESSFETVSPLK